MTHYIAEKHGSNDFSIWVTENPFDVNSGYSIRGTEEEILEEFSPYTHEDILSALIQAERCKKC